MTTEVDIANRALSEIGGPLINNFSETSTAAEQSALHYAVLRQSLLRSAAWNFARMEESLGLLGTQADGTAPWPWLYKYAYPTDCLRLRYLHPSATSFNGAVPPVVTGDSVACYAQPGRAWRFLISAEKDAFGNTRKVILSNLALAVGVYTADISNPDMFDPGFSVALEAALASKLVMPITGNVGLKSGYEQIANAAVNSARVADGQETLQSTDHTPDWILARGVPVMGALNGIPIVGDWFVPWDYTGWGY